MIEVSALKEQITNILSIIKSSIVQANSKNSLMSETDLSSVLIRPDDTILAEEIIASVKSNLQKSLSRSDFDEMMEWLLSDPGR
ncbi:MAG: hypothetical protein ACI8XC_003640 [Gammaproteobacteria bacterium]